jgi:cobalt-zinc-cadmium efflux system outer membrane protein
VARGAGCSAKWIARGPWPLQELLMSRLVTPALAAGVLAASVTACAHARPSEVDARDRGRPAPGPARRRIPEPAALEHAVATTGALAAMVELALAGNRELLAERARVEARRARVSSSARRPDLELKYEQWGVPLVRPYALDEADTVMIGLRQSFPAPGVLAARQSGAAADAGRSGHDLRARELDVTRQVERAYLEYWLAEGELRTHREHIELAQQVIELTRSRFRAGGGSEQDVLRVGVEVTALHRDLARVEQRKRSAVALLNALMGRSPLAPLTPAPPGKLTELAVPLPALQRQAAQHRPELRGAEAGVGRGQAELDEARASARWPSLMVGLDYMYMPFMHEQHAYGAMVSINLPWLSARRREEVEAAEHALTAERRSVEAVAVVIGYEVEDAFARYQAARQTYLLTRGELVPSARQSFEAARAGFAVGRVDGLAVLAAFRLLLDVRLDELRDHFALSTALADLERAVGADLATADLGTGTGAHHE